MTVKVISVPAKVRASERDAGSGSPKFGDLTITRPNGEVIVIKQESLKVAKRNKRNKRNKRTKSSRVARGMVRQISEQDTKWIELQERKAKLLRELGSIHAE